MLLALILLCVAFPLLELAVMIKVGQAIGALDTIALLIGIGIVGGLIIRAQGFAAMRRAFEMTRSGAPPLEPMVDSMLLMTAGVLFIIPGFLTDIAGALLLVPWLRHAFARWLFRRILANGRFSAGTVHVETGGPQRGGSAPPPGWSGWPPGGPSGAGGPGGPSRNGGGFGSQPHHSGASSRHEPGVVIEGEWERVDDPSKRPPAGP